MPNPDSTRRVLNEIAAIEQEFGILGASVTVRDPEQDMTADQLAVAIRDTLLRTVQITDEVFAEMNAKENTAVLAS